MSTVTLGSNIASLAAQRRLGDGVQVSMSTFERLSSGQRINRASDDAAGLAISSSLKADRRVFTQGIRNLNDGLSLLSIADGTIEQLSGIVIRLKELAEQAANGTYGVKQRKSLDGEAQALAKEYFRISRSTTFNRQGIFLAEFGELRLQGGYGENGGIQSGLGGAIGTGSFGGATSYAAESNSSNDLAFSDLNGDGILDMATSGSNGSAGYATVRIGVGDGTFRGAVSYQMDSIYSNEVELGDLNGDGIVDLVTSGGSVVGSVTIRLGQGNGTFGMASSFSFGTSTSVALLLGDVNGDGRLDIITSGYTYGESARVRLGVGDGTFASETVYTNSTFLTRDYAIGDLNGDGVVDLVSVGYDNGGTQGGIAEVRLGRGDGTFGVGTSYMTEFSDASRGVMLGDLNGDGKLDLVTAGGGGYATVRLGNGNGTFGGATSYANESSFSFDVALGDLNGDGFLDLMSAGNGGGSGRATVRLGRGDGTFGAPSSYTTETNFSTKLALEDLNGDGTLDLATVGAGVDGRATVRLSNTVSGISPLLSFELTSRAEALQALSQFENALNRLSTQRGIIGAFQSRISLAGNVLQASAENYAAAAGRIEDADVAEESAKLVRTQILQQAASAVLAQANQQPALAITLLQNR